MLEGQPGVTNAASGIPGILGLLQQQDNKPVMTPAFKPRLTTADLINQNTDSPNVVQPQVPSGQNPVQKIMEQLQELLLNGPGGGQFEPASMPTFDPNRYKKQAETSVNSQFNPIIDAIMAQQKATQGRATSNKASVAGLYQGAVNDINLGAAATQKDYDATQAQSKGLYTDERNRIAASYAADAAAQRAQAKKLGTEALGVEDAIAAQSADKNFADQMGSQQMQSSQQALGMQEQGAADYDKAIAQATRAEGIEQQQDIGRQLEDYMMQSNSDITNTRSQAAGAMNDLMYKLAQAAYDRDSQNAQFQYQQQRDYIGDQKDMYGLQRQALMDQLEAAQNATGAGSQEKLNPWQSVATFADQLQPGQGSDIVAAIQGAMSQRQEISGINPTDANGQPVKMNPALFAQLIADSQAAQGMDRNTLMMVSQELYRLLYGT
jgi:hypothetical protein